MVVAMKKLSNIERVALGSIREELQPSRLDQGAHTVSYTHLTLPTNREV